MFQKLENWLAQTWEKVTGSNNDSRKLRTTVRIIGLLLIMFFCFNAGLRASRGHGSQYDDFTAFSRSLLYDKINIYEAYAFERTSIGKYPPFFGVIFAPFVSFPIPIGASVWFAITVLLAIWSARVTVKMVWLLSEEHERRPPKFIWIAPLLMLAGLIITNGDQVNILIYTLVVNGLYQFARKKENYAGLFLGAAVAIKLTPGLFVAYFFYKGSWKTVLWSIIGVVSCLGVILIMVMGSDYYFEVMRSWLSILTPYVTEGAIKESFTGFHHTNQSLDAFFFRYFTHSRAGGGIENLYLNVLTLPYETAALIVKILKGIIILALAYFCRAPVRNRSDERLPMELSLIAIAILFISPISWINHYIIMILPFTVAIYYLWKREGEDLQRRKMLKGLMISVILISISPVITQAFSLPFIGALVLAIIITGSIHGITMNKKKPK